MYGDVPEEESSLDVSSPRDNNSPIVSLLPLPSFKESLLPTHSIGNFPFI